MLVMVIHLLCDGKVGRYVDDGAHDHMKVNSWMIVDDGGVYEHVNESGSCFYILNHMKKWMSIGDDDLHGGHDDDVCE